MAIKQFSAKNEHFKQYVLANRRLAQGAPVFVDGITERLVLSKARQRTGLRPIVYPKVGIYVGAGASHSWLWLVDLCEAVACYDVVISR